MKANEVSVLDFIQSKSKVFIIPPFQRNYDWTIEQCSELFDDLEKIYRTKKSHYLGNIIYYNGQGTGASFTELILVDGQQRITTILLLLCALRDSTKDEEFRENVEINYLVNHTKNEKYRIRLKQTSYDSQSFVSIINNTNDYDENNNIIKNYRYFKKRIADSQIEIEDLYNAILKFEIVDVNLQIDNDLELVQTVFEKINSTGKRLTAADLIRNCLLLSSSIEEQESRYRNYWINIERTLKSENISKFAKNFLVMKTYEDVEEEKIYKKFKEDYIQVEDLSRVDILIEMLKYSKYYAWLVFENCENEKINRLLIRLNLLKTDDLYPLYLYLLEKLYENNRQELLKILNLLADFMLRYRIVSPSGGGGALRSVVNQLVKKLAEGDISCSYGEIYFELSNSPTPAGRFPDDEEFKNALMESVNTNYARVLLIKIEETETKNILPDITKVTVEHLMPQTFSKWWITYYGGEENAHEMRNKYLNCIGNLAPMSQGYNSKNSNKPWHEKLKYLSDIQFNITREIVEISQYKVWNEDGIQARNEDIALRACKATIPPLMRKRDYENKSPTSEFEAGIYDMSDETTPMEGTKPNFIIFDNKEFPVSKWKEVLPVICKILFEFDEKLFTEIVSENIIHKRKSGRIEGKKDPIISESKKLLNEPVRIKGSNYYVEGNIGSTMCRRYSKQLIERYGLLGFFQISIVD